MEIQEFAEFVFETFNDSERFGVSFGMFPADKMPDLGNREQNHALTVALMKLASNSK